MIFHFDLPDEERVALITSLGFHRDADSYSSVFFINAGPFVDVNFPVVNNPGTDKAPIGKVGDRPVEFLTLLLS